MGKPNAAGVVREIEVTDAIGFATAAHARQFDKGGAPYILHPLRVMHKCWRDGLDDTYHMCAAVLHDVVEDTAVTLDQIRVRFGPIIANAVDSLSKREGESNVDYIERVDRNEIAREVKCRDIEDNMDLRRVTREEHGLYSRYAKSYRRLRYGRSSMEQDE